LPWTVDPFNIQDARSDDDDYRNVFLVWYGSFGGVVVERNFPSHVSDCSFGFGQDSRWKASDRSRDGLADFTVSFNPSGHNDGIDTVGDDTISLMAMSGAGVFQKAHQGSSNEQQQNVHSAKSSFPVGPLFLGAGSLTGKLRVLPMPPIVKLIGG
jgi:hypothetical protein